MRGMRRARRELLTVAQVAEYLQLNKLTVYRYLREGKIRAVRLGRIYRVASGDVEAFLEAQQVGRPTRSARKAGRRLPIASPAGVPVAAGSPDRGIRGNEVHLPTYPTQQERPPKPIDLLGPLGLMVRNLH